MNETQHLEVSGRWRSHCAIELNLNLNRIYWTVAIKFYFDSQVTSVFEFETYAQQFF